MPVVTLPNVSLEEFSVSCPGATPVPARARLADALEASLLTVTVALKAPLPFGENTKLTEALCPDAIVTGRLGEARAKYLLEIAIPLTVIELVPEFVAKTVRVLLLPATTLPKLRLAAPKESVLDCPEELPPALTPWQPVKTARNAKSNNALAILAEFFER